MEDIILNINNKEFNAHCVDEEHCKLLINNKPYHVDLLKKLSENVFSFSVNQKLYQVELDFDDSGKKLDINIDGLTYEIDITDETKKILNQYIKNSGLSGLAAEYTIKAPMPGMVVKNLVKEGDEVLEGDKLVIVEAMKMENVLKSAVHGKVKSIKVKEGAAVDKNTVLIELEPINE